MKNHIKITFLFLFLSVALYSQTNDSIDFKGSIFMEINNSSSEFYYPKLQDKLRNKASELTTEDCYFLYYGRVFEKNFFCVKIISLDMIEFQDALMSKRLNKAIKLGLKLLEKDPFDLAVLFHTSVSMKESGYKDNTYFIDNRTKNLIKAILSTGAGNSKQNAIKIVLYDDIFVLKGIVGFLGGKESEITENKHVYRIWEKDGNKIYFEFVAYA